MKKLLSLLLIFCFILAGCANWGQENLDTQYSELFDAVYAPYVNNNLKVDYDSILEYAQQSGFDVDTNDDLSEYMTIISVIDTETLDSVVFKFKPSFNQNKLEFVGYICDPKDLSVILYKGLLFDKLATQILYEPEINILSFSGYEPEVKVSALSDQVRFLIETEN